MSLKQNLNLFLVTFLFFFTNLSSSDLFNLCFP